MGGKQSNAWQMDIGDSGTTDHKFREEGKVKDEQHKKYAEEKAAEATEGEFIPKRGENPALAELRDRREQSAAAREAEREGDASEGTD